MAITRGQLIDPADVAALFSLANSKLPAVSPAYGASGNWLYELNRVRSALATAVDAAPVDYIVRGPWGIDTSDTTIYGGPHNLRAYGYVFPDTGSAVTLTAHTSTGGSGMNDYQPVPRSTSPSVIDHIYSSQITIVVGGDKSGRFYADASPGVYWSLQAAAGASTLTSGDFTFSSDIPGAAISVFSSSLAGSTQVYVSFDTTVSPGTYHLQISIGSTPDDWHFTNYGDLSQGLINFDVGNSTKEDYPAIHNSLATKIVRAPIPTAPIGGMPFGVWTRQVTSGLISSGWSPRAYSWTITAGLNGIWLAMACPLPTLTTETADYLPPNTPIDSVPPVEKLPAPTGPTYTITAVNNTTPILIRVKGGPSAIATGQKIYIFGCGVSAANGAWVATFVATVLVSGVWYTDFSLNGSVASGSGASGTVQIYTDIVPVQPSISYRSTRYPWMRDTDAVSPSFTYTTLYGFCIYDVIVRRAPVDVGNGIRLAPDGAADLSVSLGCMRSGSFVSFQTVTIPAGQSEVRIYPCWPIFTANALVYQSSERVMICAIPFNTVEVVAGIPGAAPGSGSYIDLLTAAAGYPITEQCGGGVYDILSAL